MITKNKIKIFENRLNIQRSKTFEVEPTKLNPVQLNLEFYKIIDEMNFILEEKCRIINKVYKIANSGNLKAWLNWYNNDIDGNYIENQECCKNDPKFFRFFLFHKFHNDAFADLDKIKYIEKPEYDLTGLF